MIVRISPRNLRGTVDAIPSKSEAHRALICAALADSPTGIIMGEGSEDIDATIRCLNAFGAQIRRTDFGLHVDPIAEIPASCDADCGESGSTLRFLLPVAGALGIDARFHMRGRLPERPIAPLDRELEKGGCELSRPERDVLRVTGKLRPGSYELPGDISSQYISGMLFAFSAMDGDCALTITGRRESADYIAMTLQALGHFGVRAKETSDGYSISASDHLRSPRELRIGGDWSNAAFWLCANALPGCEVRVTRLDASSAQGDRRVAGVLRALTNDAAYDTLDAANIPDLVPALAATVCARGQALRVVNAGRLRIKESDRIAAICRTLNALGGAASETEDGLVVEPGRALRGGEVESFGDHRIAMMAAIASCACEGEVIVRGAEAVNKSYPGFWRDFESLGGCVERTEV